MKHIAFAAALLAATPLFADTPAPGFGLETLAYPGMSATATLSSGDVVAFDGTTVARYTESGALIETVHTFPGFVFPSFLILSADESEAVFGESSNGDIFRVDLPRRESTFVARVPVNAAHQHELYPSAATAGAGTLLTNLNFNFTCAYENAGNLIVSAAVCGFCGMNEIHRVNLTSGVTTLLADVAGASGPVAVNTAGDLFYGTSSASFPPPAGSSDVVRWSAAQLTGAPVLGLADATLVAAGFDGAASFAYDSVSDELYMAENNFDSGINRIRRIGSSPATSPILLEGTPFLTIQNLDLRSGDGVAAFLPYQPQEGGTLHFNSTDFFSVFTRTALAPRRPVTFFTGIGVAGPGPLDLHVTDGPLNGMAVVLYSATYAGPAVPIYLPLLGFNLFIELDFSTLDSDPVAFLLDGDGCGTNSYVNPGGWEGTLSMQLLLLDDMGTIVGTSTASDL